MDALPFGGLEFKMEAEQYLSFQFLWFFIQKYQAALNAIGQYLAEYPNLVGSFRKAGYRKLKEELTKQIKENLAPVIEIIDAINKKVGNKAVAEKLENAKLLFNKLVEEKELTKEDLENLNHYLNYIVAELFLAPILVRLPTKRERITGGVEYVEE